MFLSLAVTYNYGPLFPSNNGLNSGGITIDQSIPKKRMYTKKIMITDDENWRFSIN